MEEDHTRILRPRKTEASPPLQEPVPAAPVPDQRRGEADEPAKLIARPAPDQRRGETDEPAKLVARPAPAAVFNQVEDDQRTVLYRRNPSQPSSPGASAAPVPQEAHNEPVVGWLVIVKGPGRGHAFSLGYGVNFLGRGDDQRICLPFGDTGIAREKHVAVTYDGSGRTFYVSQGGGAALGYHNGKPVLQMIELAPADRIRVGETELVFTPFCGPHFDWQDA